MTNQEVPVRKLMDHLFRRQAGRITSTLTGILGPAQLELAEEVVQEALLKALRQWPFHGIPENPEGWLFRVARNLAIDRLRRRRLFHEKEEALRRFHEADDSRAQDASPTFAGEVGDAQLRMMFTCCHPDLSRASRIALTLKILGGFSVEEIARAFLSAKSTVAQRLVRAKRRIRSQAIPFDVPGAEEMTKRLDSVLDVLYLLFNEGYGAHQGEDLVRRDLVGEAIRLTLLLADHPLSGQPQVQALAALMLLQAARLPARQLQGELVLLAEQDRSLWDASLAREGLERFRRSIEGDAISPYHVQAAIAVSHLKAASYDETDWREILAHYDQLLRLKPSPIFALNRAVAYSYVAGPSAALEELEGIKEHPSLQRYYLLPATIADLHRRAGNLSKAREAYERALGLDCSEPERRFLRRRLETLGSGD